MSHLKSLAAPKSWVFLRKEQKYVTSPNPGGHKKNLSLPLAFVIKQLGFADTAREVKKLLHSTEVFVDGKRVKDHRRPVGLLDVVQFKNAKKSIRIVIDEKGRLQLIDAPEKEASLKITRIQKKSVVKGGKIQLNCSDGRNVLVDRGDFKVGDSIMITLPYQKVEKHLKFDKGTTIYLTGGRHVGSIGKVDKVEGNRVWLTADKQKIETLKKLAFVVGETKPEITIK